MRCTCSHLHGEHMTEQQPEPCLARPCSCQAFRPQKDDGVLTLQALDNLTKSAGYHRAPLRVTPGLYAEMRRVAEEVQSVPTPPGPTAYVMGMHVTVVHDGTENVKLVHDVWTFVPRPGVALGRFVDTEVTSAEGSRINRLIDALPPGSLVIKGDWNSLYWKECRPGHA
jgi:hypothetical protein